MAASPSSVAARASTAASGVPPGPPLFGSFRPSQRPPFPPVVSGPGSGLFHHVPGSSSGKTAAPPSGPRVRPLAPPRSFADVVKPRAVKASQDLHLFGNPKKHPGVKRFAREGVPVVSIDNGVSSALAAPFKWTLVGKFSHGVPSFPQIRKFFDNLKLDGFINIHRLNHTHFLFVLGEELDFVRVWLGKIWHVAGFPMRLFKWTPSFDTKVESALTPVWVRLPGLPAHLFDRGVLFEIASILGKPIRADPGTALRTKFSEARFCVEIDLLLPRVDHFLLDMGGESRKQRVVYENLPFFCSFYQRVGHSVVSCFKRHKSLKLVLSPKLGVEDKGVGQLVCSSAVPATGSAASRLELANSLFLDLVARFFEGVRGVPRPPAALSPFIWLWGSQVVLGSLVSCFSVQKLLGPSVAFEDVADVLREEKVVACDVEEAVVSLSAGDACPVSRTGFLDGVSVLVPFGPSAAVEDVGLLTLVGCDVVGAEPVGRVVLGSAVSDQVVLSSGLDLALSQDVLTERDGVVVPGVHGGVVGLVHALHALDGDAEVGVVRGDEAAVLFDVTGALDSELVGVGGAGHVSQLPVSSVESDAAAAGVVDGDVSVEDDDFSEGDCDCDECRGIVNDDEEAFQQVSGGLAIVDPDVSVGVGVVEGDCLMTSADAVGAGLPGGPQLGPFGQAPPEDDFEVASYSSLSSVTAESDGSDFGDEDDFSDPFVEEVSLASVSLANPPLRRSPRFQKSGNY